MTRATMMRRSWVWSKQVQLKVARVATETSLAAEIVGGVAEELLRKGVKPRDVVRRLGMSAWLRTNL